MRHLLTITTALLLLVPATRPGFAQGAGSEWDSLKQEAMELYRAGDYGQAVVVAKRALEVAENNVGPNHPDVATSLTLLAMLYKDQGQSAQAEPLYQRALAITEKALGPDHPAVAMTLTNLAMLYMIQGQYAQAEPLYRRALAIDEKVLGPNHPNVARDLDNLVALYRATQREEEAKTLEQRAARIRAIPTSVAAPPSLAQESESVQSPACVAFTTCVSHRMMIPMHIPPDERVWRVGYDTANYEMALTEWVLEGETVDDWTELVTLQWFLGPAPEVKRRQWLGGPALGASVKSTMKALRNLRKKSCPDAVWEVLEEHDEDILYESRIRNCRPDEDDNFLYRDQHEVVRLVGGIHGVHRIAYAVAVPEMAPEVKAAWVERIGHASLVLGSDLYEAQVVKGREPWEPEEWEPEHSTPGAQLRLSKQGGKYHATASGFPSGKTYSLWSMLSFGNRWEFLTGFTADSAGKIVCTAEPDVRDSQEPLRCSGPLEKVAPEIMRPAKGEPISLALVSLDGTVRAFAKAFPRPIEDSDNSCHVWLEILTGAGDLFAARGEGFQPGEVVQTISEFEGIRHQREITTDAEGRFKQLLNPWVEGEKKEGKARYKVMATGCKLQLKYGWGRKAF
jgi:tetratricopeptide (TPR) repeat protein